MPVVAVVVVVVVVVVVIVAASVAAKSVLDEAFVVVVVLAVIIIASAAIVLSFGDFVCGEILYGKEKIKLSPSSLLQLLWLLLLPLFSVLSSCPRLSCVLRLFFKSNNVHTAVTAT